MFYIKIPTFSLLVTIVTEKSTNVNIAIAINENFTPSLPWAIPIPICLSKFLANRWQNSFRIHQGPANHAITD